MQFNFSEKIKRERLLETGTRKMKIYFTAKDLQKQIVKIYQEVYLLIRKNMLVKSLVKLRKLRKVFSFLLCFKRGKKNLRSKWK